MKKKISTEIVADSINPQGDRITTFLLTYPRLIHGELMTHRMFSRNSASSRAIPFKKMMEMIKEDPFIPIAWQKDHKGMQGNEYITDPVKINDCVETWLLARNKATREAKDLNNLHGVTKQLCNRLLEPFMWHTVLVTATEYDNFYELRCPQYNFPDVNQENIFKSRKEVIQHFKNTMYFEKYWKEEALEIEWLQRNKSQAEIHIQALAEAMWDVMNESIPNQLKAGEWHIPFGDKIDYALHKWNFLPNITELWGKDMSEYGIKIATARCARLSYMTFDGEIDYEKDIKLHDQLLESGHFSPFEHCARAMSEEEYDSFIKGKVGLGLDTSSGGWGGPPNTTYHPNENTQGWCNNFRGFIPYRYLIENEN